MLQSDFLTTGPEVPAFETAFADYVGAPHAVACANGTAALHLAALASGLQPGDQAIVPAISFVATANAVRYAGAEVVFADVDPDNGCMTAQTLAEAMARADPGRLKAVFVVHLGGQPADLAAIGALARDRRLTLIEDAAHAVGSTYRRGDGPAGRIGDAQVSDFVCFSLHPVKTITSGEGGVVTTRDPGAALRLARLRGHGLVREPEDWTDPAIGRDPETGAPNPWAYEQQMLGFNYRLTDIQAALGRSQLSKMETFAARRRRLAALYAEHLADLAPRVRLASPAAEGSDSVLHLMIALIDFKGAGVSRAQVMTRLAGQGVGSQVHYIPIHRQPYYQVLGPQPDLPGAEAYYARCLSLPLFGAMADEDVGRVAEALMQALT